MAARTGWDPRATQAHPFVPPRPLARRGRARVSAGDLRWGWLFHQHAGPEVRNAFLDHDLGDAGLSGEARVFALGDQVEHLRPEATKPPAELRGRLVGGVGPQTEPS